MQTRLRSETCFVAREVLLHSVRRKEQGETCFVALLSDSRERSSMDQYMHMFTAAEGRAQCKVVQASLKMADYLWDSLDTNPLEEKHFNVAVERKTIGNRIGDKGRGRQVTQTHSLCRAGFARTLALLENPMGEP